MSEQDRERWNARYRAGAFATRPHPNAYLEANAARLKPASRVLDLACGSGRNAHYLASLGHTVHAVDIADEGLAQVQQGSEADPQISVEQADLETDFQPPGRFDAVLILRYLNLPLVRRASRWLNPEGLLIVEVHLQSDAEGLVGPGSRRFRAEPGALEPAAAGLDVIESFEGLITDPDGGTAAVARLIARRT